MGQYNSLQVILMHLHSAMRIKYFTILLSLAVLSFSSAQELALDFKGEALGSNKLIHLEEYRGKVVLIDFWASWCPPCLLSLPAYDKMRSEIGTTEFEIIAINVDEDTDNGLIFLEDHPVSYPVLADPEGEIGKPYGIRSLPVSFLLDRDGVIVQRYRNFLPGDEIDLKQEILTLLSQ